MQIKEVVERTTRFFAEKGIETARLDCDLLVARALGWERLQLYLNFEYPMNDKELADCRELVRRRGQGEPVAYILGQKDFYKASFVVRPGVLVPRPETETLVESAVTWLREANLSSPRILDLGTGSGCIGLSLLIEFSTATLSALDVSELAISVAMENAQNLQLAGRVDFHIGRAEDFEFSGQFDVVVANPPYIASDSQDVMPSVRKFEPPEALFSDENGLGHIRRWAAVAEKVLRPGGFVIFEIGYDQGSEAQQIFRACSMLKNVKVQKDLSGLDRFVQAQKIET